jgi:hypothetical protein
LLSWWGGRRLNAIPMRRAAPAEGMDAKPLFSDDFFVSLERFQTTFRTTLNWSLESFWFGWI